MTERTARGNATTWGAAAWVLGVLVLLVLFPLTARDRLPDRLATHWGAGGEPDDSMPFWAATFFPALIWLLMAAVAVVSLWRARRSAGGTVAAPGWAGITLGFTGVTLLGAQASVVRANLDRADWRDAGPVTGWAVATLAGAVAVGVAAQVIGRRARVAGPPASGPSMEIPEGQRFVWLSRTSNRWLHVTGAVSGIVAVGATVAAVGGLAGADAWSLAGALGLVTVVVLACASVQARVTEKGLEVAFGPLGRPTRRWPADAIASARVENRTAMQVGGWGYRLNGLGTTVMLRGGECLVIRTVKGKDFAVSVDDAERGAALLNSLIGQRAK
ncbi:DUF1648 domain-containing protein [Streptomyces sp. enrichment culture]|uniref:DUF1648 domain-containing protein n=1 Tax=Streptomyces sp. enrichment culture TaxID=1795815 RepID=UPI003F55FFDE